MARDTGYRIYRHAESVQLAGVGMVPRHGENGIGYDHLPDPALV